MGTMTGTFTQPMPVGNGKTIGADGKVFQVEHGDNRAVDGTIMAEEWWCWDNLAFIKQIRLAQ
ncbi:MAG TPA: hypothetical protein VK901_13885 [Nitrospiraceae bacterium]|nr:hypothetical protein [Nitrospiraceae bacterium]